MISLLRRRGRALLLDDDPAIQRLVARLLKREGFRVDVVGKGNEAIAALRSTKYDAVILDLMMPHEGGFTVISHLRENAPDMLQRVVVLTGTPEAVVKSVAGDVFAIVHKPFEPDDLIATLRRIG